MTKLERFTMGALGWLVLAGFVWFASSLTSRSAPQQQVMIDRGTVISQCERWMVDKIDNPDTLSFQHFRSEIDENPYASVWRTKFTVRTDLNVERRYVFSCQVGVSGDVLNAWFREDHGP